MKCLSCGSKNCQAQLGDYLCLDCGATQTWDQLNAWVEANAVPGVPADA